MSSRIFSLLSGSSGYFVINGSAIPANSGSLDLALLRRTLSPAAVGKRNEECAYLAHGIKKVALPGVRASVRLMLVAILLQSFVLGLDGLVFLDDALADDRLRLDFVLVKLLRLALETGLELCILC